MDEILGHPTEEQFGRRPLDRRLVAAAVRRASAVTALSDASAAQVEAMFGRRSDVLSPGVRMSRFPAKDGPPAGEPRILFSADSSDARKALSSPSKQSSSWLNAVLACVCGCPGPEIIAGR